MGYSVELDEETTARAYGRELKISPKKAREVATAIRGKKLGVAKDLLQDVVDKKRAIPFRRYKKMVAHKKGMAAGGYPVKVAKAFLRLLESAEENAEYRGLDADTMRVAHISAYRGRSIQGYMPRAHGRSTRWNQETVNVEVILQEME
jgi:large subunit ribosomal protein L22